MPRAARGRGAASRCARGRDTDAPSRASPAATPGSTDRRWSACAAGSRWHRFAFNKEDEDRVVFAQHCDDTSDVMGSSTESEEADKNEKEKEKDKENEKEKGWEEIRSPLRVRGKKRRNEHELLNANL